jgi:hypothetical protein
MKMIDPDITFETKMPGACIPTVEEIDQLSGRDLDAFICKHVYRWVYIPVSSDADGKNPCTVLFYPDRKATQSDYNTLPLTGVIHEGWFCPLFHRDIENAVAFCKKAGIFSVPIEILPSATQLSRFAIKRFFNLDSMHRHD